MALAKATIESLVQMANVLRQSADEILSSKSEMDGQLVSFVWDDPVAVAFKGQYEEDFRPLKEKLIPNIEQYLEYIRSLSIELDAYSSDNNGSTSLGKGATTASMAAGAGMAGLGKRTTAPKGIQPKQKEVIPVEEMDMDAIREELNPKQKAYYDEQKTILEKSKEEAEFRYKIANKNAGLDRGDRVFTLEGFKAADYYKEVVDKEKELQRLDKWARETVKINRNK